MSFRPLFCCNEGQEEGKIKKVRKKFWLRRIKKIKKGPQKCLDNFFYPTFRIFFGSLRSPPMLKRLPTPVLDCRSSIQQALTETSVDCVGVI